MPTKRHTPKNVNPHLGFCCLMNFERSQQAKIGAPNATIASVAKAKLALCAGNGKIPLINVMRARKFRI